MSKKMKLELTKVNNGYILGVVNPNFRAGSSLDKEAWYIDTFVSTDTRELADLFVASLVTHRIEDDV